MASEGPTPFKIEVSDDLLQWITQRVEKARIPPGLELPEDPWSDGVPPAVIRSLKDYWVSKYNWRVVEAHLNDTLKQFTLSISESGEEIKIHFVHHKSDRKGAIPLLFQHGWPGSFLEVQKIIGLLVNPPEGKQAYHVVAPSLPGFAFSEGPKGPEFGVREMAAVNHKLMRKLGYEKYMVQGGDWGSVVVRVMALDFPESVLAIHVNALLSGPPSWWRHPLTLLYLIIWSQFQGKESFFGRLMWWQSEESGYMDIQGTKPQALSYALTDSPLGMLAWIRNIMHPRLFDDVGGFNWEDEEVITWAMIYIIAGSTGHANIYKNTKGRKFEEMKTYLLERTISNQVDFGASVFPKDVLNIPRWWASVSISPNIVFWKEHEKGGHFASTENPDKLVEDIRDFTKLLNPSRSAALKESGKLER